MDVAIEQGVVWLAGLLRFRWVLAINKAPVLARVIVREVTSRAWRFRGSGREIKSETKYNR